MTERIAVSEQWETDGYCNLCRRHSYCSKGCKAHEKRRKFELQREMAKLLLKKFSKVPPIIAESISENGRISEIEESDCE